MKKYLFLIILLLFTIKSNAQLSVYSAYDVYEKYVGQVEDMNPYEIKMYNKWINEGLLNDTVAIAWINAARAQDNLKDAPATLFDYDFYGDDEGYVSFDFTIINSTPKTIKDIKFTFEFKNEDDEIVYDIKTGRQYYSVTFSNIEGRTSSDYYADISKNILNCYKNFSSEGDATNKVTFVNKKATKAILLSCFIRYKDGTNSKKASRFIDGNIIDDGPLEPVFTFLNKITKEEEQKEKNLEESFQDDPEVPHFDGNVNQWIAEHTIYPAEAAKNGVQGKVIVKFEVEEDGSLADIRVVRSVSPELDNEALRVVNNMPKWKPAIVDGVPHKVEMTVPFTFKLE